MTSNKFAGSISMNESIATHFEEFNWRFDCVRGNMEYFRTGGKQINPDNKIQTAGIQNNQEAYT